LATWISGIPMIYYPHGLESAAIRFKISLQENAKSHAAVENIIEACHNNIVAWEKNSNMTPILLKGYDDHPKTKERRSIFEEFFSKNGIDYNQIELISGNILSKLITLIYILDYASIYLAIDNGTDPTPIAPIDFVKSKLD
jgi:glucose/mannose-6-phosphate isomerase